MVSVSGMVVVQRGRGAVGGGSSTWWRIGKEQRYKLQENWRRRKNARSGTHENGTPAMRGWNTEHWQVISRLKTTQIGARVQLFFPRLCFFVFVVVDDLFG